ncbi:MAG: hypothetical protein ACHQRL_02915 [Gemmatimonadales bacterium]
MTMVSPWLKGVDLSPGQLAELRAIDALYYSRLESDSASRGESSPALTNLVLVRVRDMLHDEQRVMFDRNRGGARNERYP